MWPREQPARFGRLRAHGAFLVSSELKNGEVRQLTIESEQGRDCCLLNPWPRQAIKLVRNGEVEEAPMGKRLIFQTAPGDRLEFRPE